MREHSVELEFECCAGCNVFMCGSIKHLKECGNYEESMSYMLDKRDEQIEKLEKLVLEVGSRGDWEVSSVCRKIKDIQDKRYK